MINSKMKMRTRTVFQVCSEFDNEKTYYLVDLVNWTDKTTDEEISDEKINEDMKPMTDDKILFIIDNYFEQFKEHPSLAKEIKESVELTKLNKGRINYANKIAEDILGVQPMNDNCSKCFTKEFWGSNTVLNVTFKPKDFKDGDEN